MHKTSCLTILPCLDFMLYDPDFKAHFAQIPLYYLALILGCAILISASLISSLPDFVVLLKGIWSLFHSLKYTDALILISGYILFTNPPSYLYNLALISGCLILISWFVLSTNFSTLLNFIALLCTNPPTFLYFLALISRCVILILGPMIWNSYVRFQGVWSWYQGS